MGLTRNHDIDELENEIAILKTHVELLINKVFEDSDILLLDDSTWENVRKKRDCLLQLTDWVMTPGATVDQGAWASYRQTLRDIPQTFKKEPSTVVVWPIKPSFAGPNTVK
jgi:hypothetical protein